MYLKELEINHFKSFSGSQRIPFNNNFIVITGPNGSGKSNILDAIRWVLGEQRSKLLRAEKSEEVIFGGNKLLLPSKYTQVSITLSFPQEKDIFQEVIIARRLERNGESEYSLNDRPIRLKDLQLLLSSYGLGKHNFIFIGQGELENLILNNGERLREFIEDVSGIAGYQDKVKETQIRLEIISAKWKELEEKRLTFLENLEILRKEAEIADYYLNLSKELEEIRESLIFYQWQKFKKNFENYENEMLEKEKNLEELRRNFSEVDSKLLSLRNKKEDINSKIKGVYKNWEEYKKLLSECQMQIEIISQRIIDFNDRKGRIEKEIEENEKELKSVKEELDGLNETLKDEGETETISLEKELKEKERELREKQILKVKNEQRLNSFGEFISFNRDTLISKLEILENSIKRVDKSSENLKNRKRVFEEYSINLLKEIKEKESLIRLKERYLEEINFEFQKERRLLRDLEEIQLDNYPKGVREILTLKDNEVIGIVADVIEVEKEYLISIYNVLGNSLFDIIVKDEYSAERLIRYLRERNLGWATFRPLSFYKDYKERKVKINNVLWALDVISFLPQYKELVYNLLGNVLIFKDFESALRGRYLLKEGWRLVTLKGEVFLGNGTISGGVRTNIQTTLNITRTKQEKEEKINELSKSIALLESDLINLRNLRKNLLEKKEKIDSILKKIDKKSGELSNKIKDLSIQKEKISLFLKEGEEILRVNEKLDLEIGNIERELELKKKKYEEMRGEYIFLKKKRNFLEERRGVLEKKIDELKLVKEGLEKELERLISNLKNLESKKISIAKEEEELRGKVKEKEEEIKELEDTEEILRKEWQNLREKIIVEETTLQQLKRRKKELEKEFKEKFEKEPSLKVELSESKLKMKEKEILKEIESLGPINFVAKEKLPIEEKRYKELSEQVEDIYGSISSLKKIIKDTKREAEIKFLSCYERLREVSNKNWKLFFPHGELDLVLSNPEEPLNSEVSIKITSNKKNYKSILMLSGGEKSITALSLLLAGLEIAPINFCFWDEVDSALDNHNAEILGRKIKELSKDIQFILISHNPILMEFSEILYGVTLNDKGSSQLLSYKLEREEIVK